MKKIVVVKDILVDPDEADCIVWEVWASREGDAEDEIAEELLARFYEQGREKYVTEDGKFVELGIYAEPAAAAAMRYALSVLDLNLPDVALDCRVLTEDNYPGEAQ